MASVKLSNRFEKTEKGIFHNYEDKKIDGRKIAVNHNETMENTAVYSAVHDHADSVADSDGLRGCGRDLG
jgi:hypothetical protein